MRALRTIIFILVCLGLLWLFIALLVNSFSGGNKTEIIKKPALTTYTTTNTEAQMLIAGPIIQKQGHESVRITVSRTQTQIEVFTGYDGQVIEQRTYPNTENSFKQFLAALDQFNFSQGLVADPTMTEQGKCPLGNRISYILENGTELIGRGWVTTCGTGTFAANRGQIQTLFIRQIPPKEYTDISKGLRVI